jgi:hypothetical protein
MIRTLLAGLGGYFLIGLLIGATDRLLAPALFGFHSSEVPAWYYAFSMVTDTIYTFIGGWFCALISRRDPQATLGLIVMGELMGIASTVYLWHKAPHYYSFYLLLVYPPAIWYGAKWRKAASDAIL